MKKTDRKNKTNLTVTWPSNVFTIEDLSNLNSEFVIITLRVRLKNAIEASDVTRLGVIPNGKGRPTNAYVYGTVTEAHIDEAKNRGVLLNDGLTVSVNATTEESAVTEAVVEHEVEVESTEQHV